MNQYKVSITNSVGWRDYKVAKLGVSITSNNWQGAKFAAILDFCAARFAFLQIDVTDALYRHNFMAEGMEQGLALQKAKALGDLWLTQHEAIISSCAVPYEIIRWAEWYEHSEYLATLQAFKKLYDTDREYHCAVEEDLKMFYRRLDRNYNDSSLKHSRDFLFEEAAVLTLQSRALPSVTIYPGEDLISLQLIRKGFIPEAPKGLEAGMFGQIKFDKRKSFRGEIASSWGPKNV